MSTWMCENCCRGTGMGCKAAAGCRVTLEGAHSWQSATQAVMSLFLQVHTTRSCMQSCFVALAPGWAWLWNVLKTWWRWPSGMTGGGWRL
jgi:hypothetical protein